MLEVYKSALRFLWTITKSGMIGLSLMLPGLILIAYMVATKNTDISWWVVAWDLVAIALWAPIVLRFAHMDDYGSCTLWESYRKTFEGIAMSIIVGAFIAGWLIWVCLPILAGLTISALLNREPKGLEVVATLVFNVIWAPGAHYLYDKWLDKVFDKSSK
jgi:hypothetical protein